MWACIYLGTVRVEQLKPWERGTHNHHKSTEVNLKETHFRQCKCTPEGLVALDFPGFPNTEDSAHFLKRPC